MAENVSLREHINALRQADQLAVSAALAAQEKATSTALAAAEKAVLVAETNSQRWRDNANEWRGAMTDREHAFLTRRELYAMVGTAISVLGFFFLLTK